MPRQILVFAVVCLSLTVASAQLFVTTLYDFLSRPDIRTPRLQTSVYEPSEVDAGYIFLTPASRKERPVNYDFAPTIYDNYGELVWYGRDPAISAFDDLMGFDMVNYNNKSHLAFYTLDESNLSRGHILDDNYQPVQQAAVARLSRDSSIPLHFDLHVFNVITPSTLAIDPPPKHDSREVSNWVRGDDPDTAILSTAAVRRIHPPAVICGRNISWVRDGPFQEVSLEERNKVLFEWNPADHIPVEESKVCPGESEIVHLPEIVGTTAQHPFDFIHRNAVDKLPDGDFVVSARYTDTIYKISHVDGSIVWRLGDNQRSNFTQTSLVPGVSLEFSGQHDIRVASDVPGADPANKIFGLTLWDNANIRYDKVGASNNRSLAKTILVNENNMTAVLTSAFALPRNELGVNQGSHQALPNGNHLIGGGNLAEVVEYRPKADVDDASLPQDPLHPEAGEDSAAELVFAAHFGGGPMNSYRARRYEWHGQPTTQPDVFAYRRSCTANGNSTFVYVSWNGATEVSQWVVWGAAAHGSADDQFRELASARKTGFETAIAISHEDDYDEAFSEASSSGRDGFDSLDGEEDAQNEKQVLDIYVVAHGADGAELGRSARVAVWVPRDEDVLPSRYRRSDSSAESRRKIRRDQPGDCGDRRCREGFKYTREHSTDCTITSSPVN